MGGRKANSEIATFLDMTWGGGGSNNDEAKVENVGERRTVL